MNKTKVFVAVGTHPQQFDRLIKQIDEIALKRKDFEFFGQVGNCNYKPKNFKNKNFLSIEEFDEKIVWADLIIMHAGAGTFSKCNRLGKKIIVVPRVKEFNEHTDDHQKELAQTIKELGFGIVCNNVSELEDFLDKAKSFKQKKLEKGNIIEILNNFFSDKV
ncbi:MAG: PssE/Cps14G family polysaccharide biosynthesis glycosyltransferase [Candidatus Diapherotrites archaeon]